MSSTKEYFEKFKKSKERTSAYINGKTFNKQAGDKKREEFYIKPMPRFPKAPSEICEGNFYDFWVHRQCGSDGYQQLVCLNRTQEEFKSNKKKCPACKKIRKVFNNKEDYDDETNKKAYEQRAVNVVLWPVYDLKARKEVEYMEVSPKATKKIFETFEDDEGNFRDATDIKNTAAIKVIREGSGLASEYTWKGMSRKEFALTNKDIQKIKATLKQPESVVVRLPLQEFKDIFEGAFEIETTDENMGGLVEPEGSPVTEELEDLNEGNEEKPVTKPKQKTRQRPKAKAEEALEDALDNSLEESVSESAGESSSDVADDLIKDIEDLE